MEQKTRGQLMREKALNAGMQVIEDDLGLRINTILDTAKYGDDNYTKIAKLVAAEFPHYLQSFPMPE